MLADAQPNGYVPQYIPNKKSSNSQVCGEQGASKSHPQFQQLKLALDVHAASLVVVRMVDGAKSQPPQRFKPADFLVWAKKHGMEKGQTKSGSSAMSNGSPPSHICGSLLIRLPRRNLRALSLREQKMK